MNTTYFLKMTLLCIALLIGSSLCFSQAEEMPLKLRNMTEPELIEGLANQDPVFRELVAAEIKYRLKHKKNVVKEGNIIEHSELYWKRKVRKIKDWTPVDEFEKEFGVSEENRLKLFSFSKVYQLDYMNVIYVTNNRDSTKVKFYQLLYEPIRIGIEEPQNFTGQWNEYTINGDVAVSTTYDNGKKHGEQTIYYDEEVCCLVNYFKEDILYEQRRYTSIGELVSIKVYNKQEQEAWLREYELEGQPQD